MTENDFEALKKIMLAELDGLSPNLTYHSKEHTLDVIEQSTRIACREGVNESDLLTLRIAALFHDTGFMRTYLNHEVMGCKIFLEKTEGMDFSEKEKKAVQELIMATKLPQAPVNHLQSIICDADLDYLGRDDFFRIGNNLKKEFLYYKIVASEADWEKLQLTFLSHHHYHTKTSQQLREPVKQKHYSGLINT